MIPKEFTYVAPSSVAEAVAALRDGGEDAKALAGGHSLIPTMKLRLGAPSTLVDLRNIADLRRIDMAKGGIEIGAMITYHQLTTDSAIRDDCPLLAECAASVGDMQVRARGTIGGSLAHSDPAADLPAAILALDATIITDKREIAARDFFVDLFTTALEPGEIITAVRVPNLAAMNRTGSAYVKIRNKASHYALVGCAAIVGMGDDGSCNNIALGTTGAASKAFRLDDAEKSLKGTRLSDDDLSKGLGSIEGLDVDWMDDLFGSADYRKHLTGVAARRALNMAKSRI